MTAYTYPLADLFGTMLGIFVFLIWFWLLVIIFGDIFRSRDMGGGAKALWVLFVIILPFLGILVYLIARGGKMHERAEQAAQQQQQAFDQLREGDRGGREQRRPAGQAGRPQEPGRHHRRRVRGAEGQAPRLARGPPLHARHACGAGARVREVTTTSRPGGGLPPGRWAAARHWPGTTRP